jgi:hypothetical protein
MRKFLVSAAIATATIAAAAPASAQWAPPHGNAYGYHHNRGQVQRLEVRVDQIRRQIRQLDRRNIISEREAFRLSEEARDLDRRIDHLARNGFSGRDRFEVERRIARLEQRIYRDVNDGRGHNGYGNGYNGYNGYDRDRDGRDDRFEDDRGRYPG